MTRLAVVAVIALAACTRVFDLSDVPSIDRDNDGVVDALDNCADDFNPDQSDYDRNGIGDACDACATDLADDADDDDILDACDGCIGIGVDADRDRIDDGCDPCQNTNRDVDQDGVDDGCDACIGESTGIDVDADGVDDSCDQCIGNGRDADGDLIDDGCDPCLSTAPKVDADGDGTEDACDVCVPAAATDDDGDQIPDECDACVCIPQPNCATSIEHDEDGDRIDDGCDNCKALPNPGQNALNDDAVGNACDLDAIREDFEDFDSFTTADPSWYVQGVGWSHGIDVLHVASTTFEASYHVRDTFAVGELSVSVGVEPDGLRTGSRVSVFVANAFLQPSTEQVQCVLTVGGSTVLSARVQLIQFIGGTASPMTASSATGFQLTKPFRLVLYSVGNGTYACSIVTDSGVAANVEGTSMAGDGNTGWRPGFAAANANVSFRFFDLIAPVL